MRINHSSEDILKFLRSFRMAKEEEEEKPLIFLSADIVNAERERLRRCVPHNLSRSQNENLY